MKTREEILEEYIWYDTDGNQTHVTVSGALQAMTDYHDQFKYPNNDECLYSNEYVHQLELTNRELLIKLGLINTKL